MAFNKILKKAFSARPKTTKSEVCSLEKTDFLKNLGSLKKASKLFGRKKI